MADKEVLNEFKGNRFDYFNTIMDNKTPIEINRVEKMVLISLIRHNNWKTGICNPTIKTIQNEWFYKSDREVIEALKTLREKNFFTKKTIKRRNYYQLNIALILKDYLQNDGNPQNVGNLQNEGDNIPQNVGNDYPQNEGTNIKETEKEHKNIYSSNDEDNIPYFERINKEIDDLENEINNKYGKDLITKEKEKLINKNLGTLELLRELKKQLDKSIKRNSNQDIEEIWSLYPLKKGKASAIKKMPKLLKEYGKEQIVRCIERYIEEIKKENKSKEFILHGSTFFNGRYIDYLDCNYQEDIITKPKEKTKLNHNTSNFDY